MEGNTGADGFSWRDYIWRGLLMKGSIYIVIVVHAEGILGRGYT